MASKLSNEQVEYYRENGYLTSLDVFDESETDDLLDKYNRIEELMPEGRNSGEVVNWHKFDKTIFDICCDKRILDIVEQIIGPNIIIWGSQLIAKPPLSKVNVDWHQDSFYWPLKPMTAVTVWIAMIDSTEEVGCMQVVPKTHKDGLLKHHYAPSIIEPNMEIKQGGGLYLELDKNEYDIEKAIPIELKAGQISLHHADTVHGSDPNISKDKKRVGLIARFSPPDIKCDLTIWQKYHQILVRGVDNYKYNPTINQPTNNLNNFIETLPLTTQIARDRQVNQVITS